MKDRSKRRWQAIRNTFAAIFLFLSIVAVACAISGYILIRGSLAQNSGETPLTGLKDSVTIEIDKQGIPTIYASNRPDLIRALGFKHAQERFFQMDLLRRSTAGELSELFGPVAINFDKGRRLHQFRQLASQVLEQCSPEEREVFCIYTDGVNQGLQALSVRPWEYLVLRSEPAPWSSEDCVLSGLTMFLKLQDSEGITDITRGCIGELFPKSVYHFFVDNGTRWNATIDDTAFPILPIPDAKEFAFLKEHSTEGEVAFSEPTLGGSNQWAMSSEHTGGNGAIVACDMHLPLSVPNVWYRAAFEYESEGQKIRVDGVTLPGNPLMVLGSNGHIAWGLTNAQINTTDVVIVEPVSETHYKTPKGPKPFEKVTEVIQVKGAEPQVLEITKTQWGPVLNSSFFDKPVALCWLAHDPSCINLEMTKLEQIHSVKEALDCAHRSRVPVLNFVVGDKEGNIGWTLIGYVPKREGYDGTVPVSFADGKARWLGSLSPEETPTIYNPQNGILWTANNRVVGEPWFALLGDGCFYNSVRAYQIKKRLLATDVATPKNMLDIQLDDEAIYLRRWQTLLLDLLQNNEDKTLQEVKQVVASWSGHAAAESPAYNTIRSFRQEVSQALKRRIFAACYQANDLFDLTYFDFEEPIWLIASEKPAYLLGTEYSSWDEELLSHLKAAIQPYQDDSGHVRWSKAAWGRHNRVNIHHPLAKALPVLSFLIDFPNDPSSGDMDVPRVSRPHVGASQRMVVTPGKEEEGIAHLPCGQSGNPLSPYYRTGHADWLEGRPSPYLPGETIATLTLLPQDLTR